MTLNPLSHRLYRGRESELKYNGNTLCVRAELLDPSVSAPGFDYFRVSASGAGDVILLTELPPVRTECVLFTSRRVYLLNPKDLEKGKFHAPSRRTTLRALVGSSSESETLENQHQEFPEEDAEITRLAELMSQQFDSYEAAREGQAPLPAAEPAENEAEMWIDEVDPEEHEGEDW